MKKYNILIIDNGFKSHKNHFIESLANNNMIKSKIIYNYNYQKDFNVLEKVFLKFRIPLDLTFLNYRFIRDLAFNSYNAIIIIKGNNIFPISIFLARILNNKVTIISWSLDNMIKKHNSSLYFKFSIPLYDIIYTTKSNTIKSFKKLNARRVEFITQAYSRFEHYPDNFSKDHDYGILFIGSPENDRIEKLKFLSEKNIIINVFGNGWEKYDLKKYNNIKLHDRALLGSDFRKAISSSKISLNFLRKINDDIHTSRTFEIPACGGFMISERSNEHSKFFIEDEEAIYFDDSEELYQKIIFYKKDEKRREKIRLNGYKKVQNLNNTYCDMVETILDNLKKFK